MKNKIGFSNLVLMLISILFLSFSVANAATLQGVFWGI
jgi:hypothetical protein